MGVDLVLHWGCVAASVTGNIVEVKGRMDSTKYQLILEANVWLRVSEDIEAGIYKQDNAPKHTSKSNLQE